MTKYPEVNDINFNDKITKIFEDYKIPKKKKTFDEICFPKKFELQKPQEFVAEYINPKTPYKDLLVFHNIGAGKTCAAVNIAEKWKNKRNIIISAPASLIGNFRNELRSKCAGDSYINDTNRDRLKKTHPTSKEYKDIIKQSDDKIDKNYLILSHTMLMQQIKDKKLKLKNSILIIDEIQNLVSESGSYYQILYEFINTAPDDLRVILLSATPIFDKPVEIALTLNLLRLPKKLPIGTNFSKKFIKNYNSFLKSSPKNLDIFKNMIKGYVSYYRGAPPYTFPTSTVKYIKCEMSEFQYKSYLTVLSKEAYDNNNYKKMEGFHTGNLQNLPNNFFIGSRMISNISFPNKNANLEGYNSLNNKTLSDIETYSCKFAKLLLKLKSANRPVFIYSNFKGYGGLQSLIKVLEHNGYLDYSTHREGKKRFAVWTGETSYELKEEIKSVFNNPKNINGSSIKIVLGSPSTKEGISFFNIQQVHILEPYWNNSRILQIIGRAVRYCSHKLLPEEKRDVKVYIYVSTHPLEKMTIDEYIVKIAQQKSKIINSFELALKESAIDCQLFKNGNVFEGDKDIKCIK